MSGQDIRKRFMRQFVGLAKYPRFVAYLVVGSYVGQILLAIYAGHWLLSLPLTIWTGLSMAVVAFFIGTRLRGLNNIVHECTHNTFSEHRPDNTRIGSICAAILTGCFRQYRDEHLTHHAHLGDYELDMDLKGIERFRLHDPLTPRTILRHIFVPLLGLHMREYSGVNFSSDGPAYQVLKFVLLSAMFSFVFIAPMTAILFVLLPLFYIYPTINYWTDCMDHAGIVAQEDELDASRNVLAPKPLRYLLFPRNDCFHLVHHLFPQVPARHLETVHRELESDPSYRSQPLAVQPSHKAIAGLAFSGNAARQS